MSDTPMDAALERLNQLTDQNYPVVYFDTTQSVHIVELFRNFALISTKAIYHWLPESGMYRMDANHILIPNTQKPRQLLKTINDIAHFGIFLLSDFHEHATERENIELLKKMAAMQDVNPKTVVLLGNDIEIANDLKPFVAHIRHTNRSQDDGHKKAG